MLREQGQNAVILPMMMDTHFISFIEMKNEGVTFRRIDSAIADAVSDGNEKCENSDELIDIFKKALGDESLKIEVQGLKSEDIPAMVLLSEQSRRMKEMYRSYGQQFAGMSEMFKDEYTLTLNPNNALIKKLPSLDEDTKKLVCEHIYDLAMLSNKPLEPEAMTKFVERSNKLLQMAI